MRKNGFTLIELLAVIVILAIIAVIAVPIVLNIIDESKESATLRSAEMYMDAVEISIANRVMHHGSIADGAYSIMSDGDICLGDYNQTSNPKTCVGKLIDTNNDNILKIEVNGEKPTSGKIYIEKGQIFKEVDTNKKTWLVISEKKIEPVEENGEVKFGIVSSENNKEEEKTLAEVCTYQNNGVAEKTAGAKYSCKVDPNKDPYTFYVLTTPTSSDTSINLIMDRNICEDGTPTAEEKTCLVAWISTEKYYEDVGGVIPDDVLNDEGACQYEGFCSFNDKGPLTAMKFLQEATKNWTNTNEMLIDKFDNDAGVTFDMQAYNTYARMPYYSEVSSFDTTKNNGYLYDYLGSYNSFQSNPISGIDGYWALSSYAGGPPSAWLVDSSGYVEGDLVDNDSHCGVRAVINLKI